MTNKKLCKTVYFQAVTDMFKEQTTKEANSSQSAVSKHLHRKLSCRYSSKRCTSNWDNLSFERQGLFPLWEIQNPLTPVGTSTSTAIKN